MHSADEHASTVHQAAGQRGNHLVAMSVTTAWLTSTTDFQVYVDVGEAIAFWEADIDGEFELADSLTSEVELMVNALNAKRSLSKRIVEEEHMPASDGCRRNCVIANTS